MAERYLDTLVEKAAARLDPHVLDYFLQGARDGISAAEAVPAWDRFRFLPRVLRDVTEVDLRTTLLGTRLRTPFAIAPSTLQKAAHPDGEVAMARAACAAGALLVVSSNSGSTFEDIAATGVDWWLQMYIPPDRSAAVPVVERALAPAAKALVLTADTPVVGTKYSLAGSIWDHVRQDWLRVNFADAEGALAPTPEKAADLGPQDVAWLVQRFGLPVVVKGVLHPSDAHRCEEAGASAVWVSNHGGRQLDQALSTADALEEVAAALGPATEVYVDGGVRKGAHALAAGALGAKAVFLGRPPLLALAADGESGVHRLLNELAAELEEALRLSGHTRLTALPADLVTGSRHGR